MLVVEFKLYDTITKTYTQTQKRMFIDVDYYEGYIKYMADTYDMLVLPIHITCCELNAVIKRALNSFYGVKSDYNVCYSQGDSGKRFFDCARMIDEMKEIQYLDTDKTIIYDNIKLMYPTIRKEKNNDQRTSN